MTVRPGAWTTTAGPGIVAIDTEYTRPHHDASHLIVEDGRAAFVDTGPNSAVLLLLDALAQHDLDVADVAAVFLTHVHLDHAGGAGLLLQSLPNARCVLHPRGAPHIANPEKLVAGTEAVYGRQQARELYGDIVPVDPARIDEAADGQDFDLNGRKLTALHTEGHARHHYCLHDPASRGVFTGDSFGISYREFDTAAGPFVYPSSTPPHFDPAEAHKAIDRILACEPEQLYLTHFSRVGDVERLAGDMHVCIDAYAAMAMAHRDVPDREQALEQAMFALFVERLEAHGYSGDRDTIWSLTELDVVLNAQGLDAWLNWLDRQATKTR